MALAPFKPYVNSPGLNPTSANTYTSAAAALYPAAAPNLPTIPGAGTSSQPTVPNSVSPTDWYAQLLGNDPLLKNALVGVNSAGVQNQAQLRAGIQKAVGQYGAVPSSVLSAPGVGDAIDQTTRDLASQNTAAGTSTVARESQAYRLAQQAHVADEAARGMLRSGAFGQHSAEDLLGYQQQQATDVGQLLDYLSGLYSGYLSQQQALQQQAAGDTNDAATRIQNQILAGQLSYPKTFDNPNYYTTSQLAQIGAPAYTGPVQFSPDAVTNLAHQFGSLTPEQLQALGVGTAQAAPAPAAPAKAPAGRKAVAA